MASESRPDYQTPWVVSPPSELFVLEVAEFQIVGVRRRVPGIIVERSTRRVAGSYVKLMVCPDGHSRNLFCFNWLLA